MNKVVYVPAFFKPIGKEVTKKVPTGEKKKGFFGGEKDVTQKVTDWQQTGYSDRWVDGERLSVDISNAVSKLNEESYEVVSVTPLTSGEYDYKWELYKGGVNHGGGGFGYGYGYSYTEGVIIIAKKIA
ncbi:hypothetical protein CUU95_02680 [Vreelandella alkaliphila]|uniref:hypothetical protein n=1 Tax=Vreelandella alkaliphila TaxID=272774 RepID=UPI000EA2FE44|nr:hypothetical protein [Halomonas alkaliphila]AYF32797.1 hypothetical protein CUU95_02680 [Halomonas alkaliphila]